MVKNSLMLFSPSPKSLSKLIVGHTFSQSLSKLVIGHTCSTHAHLLPKVCRSWLLGTLHPNHYPHAQLHINSHTPYTHTNHTPTIHRLYNPTTQPIPLLLRVDSDEMRQNRKVLAHEVLECSQRAPYGAKSPRSGLRACAGANEGG